MSKWTNFLLAGIVATCVSNSEGDEKTASPAYNKGDFVVTARPDSLTDAGRDHHKIDAGVILMITEIRPDRIYVKAFNPFTSGPSVPYPYPDKKGWLPPASVVSLDEHIIAISERRLRMPDDTELLRRVALAFKAKGMDAYSKLEAKDEQEAKDSESAYEGEAISAISCAIALLPKDFDLYIDRATMRPRIRGLETRLAVMDLDRAIELIRSETKAKTVDHDAKDELIKSVKEVRSALLKPEGESAVLDVVGLIAKISELRDKKEKLKSRL